MSASVVSPSVSQQKIKGHAVLLMRAQPFHNGHAAILTAALDNFEAVTVLLGSANRGRSHHHNPFTFEERSNMLMDWLRFSYCHDRKTTLSYLKIIISPMRDFISDGQWNLSVMEKVREVYDYPDEDTYLVTHHKGSDTEYLNMFPQWKSWPVPTFYREDKTEGAVTLNATDLRKIIFDPLGLSGTNDWQSMVPPSTFSYVRSLMESNVGDLLRAGARAQDDYLARWGKGPFITTDAVVLSAGHVILGQRTQHPGLNQFCLPGGFLQDNERIVDGIVRELVEETEIKLQPTVLKRNIRHQIVVDDPHRGGRGRNVTHVALIVLNDRLDQGLPKLRGLDDLGHPQWVSLNNVPWNNMFEDHALILEHMLRFV